MNLLEKDGVYKALRVRTGTSTKGPWKMLVTADDGGNNQVPVFVYNPEIKINDGEFFRIVEIRNIRFGHMKNAAGNWEPNCTVNAVVEKTISYEEYFAGGNPFDKEEL